MPFATDFDDVYSTIKDTVDSLLENRCGKCFRLDENRPAGRITERLLRELQSADLCVADVTGNTPNVMWEVGYVMALEKPTILLTQALTDLPFDIQDVQTIHYDRKHLNHTLRHRLSQVVLDTINVSVESDKRDPLREKDELVGTRLVQIQELKSMLREAVGSWKPAVLSAETQSVGLAALEGAWFNPQSGSHHYAELINDELVVPYCYKGNSELTGVYYGWKRTGDYWFARFVWLHPDRLHIPVSGFSFMKQESTDRLTGAWWHDKEVESMPSAPPREAGVPSIWQRQKHNEFPTWARQFLEKVRQHGLMQLI